MSARAFERGDWVGSIIGLPDRGQVLKCVDASGPFFDPTQGDYFWWLRLEDDTFARMWEDHKGVVTDERANAGLN